MKRQLSSIITALLLAFGQLFPFLTILQAPVYAEHNSNHNPGGGTSPSVECGLLEYESFDWNGNAWKIQINNGELGGIETEGDAENDWISPSLGGGIFSWANESLENVYGWVEKNGNVDNDSHQGFWGPGDGDSDDVDGSLSHVTICFTDEGIADPASITIVKDAVPNDPQDFEFTSSLLTFYLDDDDDATLPNQKTFEAGDGGDLVVGETYTFTEGEISGWDLTSISCEGTEDWDLDLENRSVSITVNDQEYVTCTFTNTQIVIEPGSITVDKVTLPSGSLQSFNFNLTGSATDSVSLTDGDNPHTFSNLFPGNYSLGEEPITGWDLTSTSCVDKNQSPVDASDIDLSEGDSVTCTFTNTQRGHIIVEKVTNPVDTDQIFDFTLDGIGTTKLGSGESDTFSNLLPGTYNLSEDNVPGWSLTGVICSDESDPSEIDLNPGETVTCTFTNERLPLLTVIKNVVNNGEGTAVASDFTITVSGLNVSSSVFEGSEGGTTVTLDAGQYLVLELPAAGYTVSYSADCEGTIGVGESKTCIVTNNDQDVLGEDTEGEVLGAELPETGAAPLNLAIALSSLSIGIVLRRKTNKS